MNELKHEDHENHAINLPFTSEQQFESVESSKREKTDEALEKETRGVDFKGNVRYFCPKCNVSVPLIVYLFSLNLTFISFHKMILRCDISVSSHKFNKF